MATWKGYKGVSVGLARVMGETPFSDGTTANLIQNWTVDENGMMSSRYRLMPLIPNEWNSSAQPDPFVTQTKIGTARVRDMEFFAPSANTSNTVSAPAAVPESTLARLRA